MPLVVAEIHSVANVMASCQSALGTASFPTKWMIPTYRLGYISQQYKLTYILTHALAPELPALFLRKRMGKNLNRIEPTQHLRRVTKEQVPITGQQWMSTCLLLIQQPGNRQQGQT